MSASLEKRSIAELKSSFLSALREVASSFTLCRKELTPIPFESPENCGLHLYTGIDLEKCCVSPQGIAEFGKIDACQDGIAGALLHKYPTGDLRLVAFISRTLMPAKKNYIYLMGCNFVVQTGRRPLTSILGETKGIPQMAASRLQRWSIFLSGFSDKIDLEKDIERVCKICRPCQTISNNPIKSMVILWNKPDAPARRIHADFMGPISFEEFLAKKWEMFEEGQRVLVKDYRNQNSLIWTEATITEILGDKNDVCQLGNGRIWKRHLDQIKKVDYPLQPKEIIANED
ncbi:hypothetical protein ILUMI_01094 [Ignelater luminosus]|uniref:Uncharacterized protein n=1 Tax=Ignelater luminosus TaxID=2038154 RepID=A0A8K0DRD7_IGNLU|nr:hypothetical protein ILUMI_01094 [Ignelater luminosus]